MITKSTLLQQIGSAITNKTLPRTITPNDVGTSLTSVLNAFYQSCTALEFKNAVDAGELIPGAVYSVEYAPVFVHVFISASSDTLSVPFRVAITATSPSTFSDDAFLIPQAPYDYNTWINSGRDPSNVLLKVALIHNDYNPAPWIDETTTQIGILKMTDISCNVSACFDFLNIKLLRSVYTNDVTPDLAWSSTSSDEVFAFNNYIAQNDASYANNAYWVEETKNVVIDQVYAHGTASHLIFPNIVCLPAEGSKLENIYISNSRNLLVRGDNLVVRNVNCSVNSSVSVYDQTRICAQNSSVEDCDNVSVNISDSYHNTTLHANLHMKNCNNVILNATNVGQNSTGLTFEKCSNLTAEGGYTGDAYQGNVFIRGSFAVAYRLVLNNVVLPDSDDADYRHSYVLIVGSAKSTHPVFMYAPDSTTGFWKSYAVPTGGAAPTVISA